MTISEQLKAVAERSGQTMYQLAKGSGLSYPVVYRFLMGERSLKLESADKLAAYLKLELKARRKAKR